MPACLLKHVMRACHVSRRFFEARCEASRQRMPWLELSSSSSSPSALQAARYETELLLARAEPREVHADAGAAIEVDNPHGRGLLRLDGARAARGRERVTARVFPAARSSRGPLRLGGEGECSPTYFSNHSLHQLRTVMSPFVTE